MKNRELCSNFHSTTLQDAKRSGHTGIAKLLCDAGAPDIASDSTQAQIAAAGLQVDERHASRAHTYTYTHSLTQSHAHTYHTHTAGG